MKDLAAVSLRQPVRIFVNSNTDVAPYLRQEFVRIRPNKEGDREAVVAGRYKHTYNVVIHHAVILHAVRKGVLHVSSHLLVCRFSSPDKNISGPRDVFHSDKKTSSQAAYFVGTDGTEGRRIARRTEPEPEAGEPQVSYEHNRLIPFW